MNKTIIAIYGRSKEGKSETIKNIASIFEKQIAHATVNYLINSGDILAIVTLGNIKIGLESQGDPNSRMINDNTIQQLINMGCEIIVCASRTEGMTVAKVDDLASRNGFNTLWKSSYYTNGLNYGNVNMIAAEETIKLIQSIIVARI
ncbi:MAG: hypothetical protein V4717_23450 [Bacteroidota bacterium]